MQLPGFPFHILWHVVWDMTRRCNLRCSYCPVNQDEPVRPGDTWDIAKAIIGCPPEFLILTGGEPTLLDDLPDVLAAITSRRPHTKVILNTNGLRLKAMERALPYVARLAISLDSLDESNRKNRGIGPEQVTANIAELAKSDSVSSGKAQICVAAVVTRDTLESIPRTIAGIKQIHPCIELDFKPMLPYSDKRSPFCEPGLKARYFTMAETYRDSAYFYGTGRSKRLTTPFLCWAQFLKLDINVQGDILSCRHFNHSGDRLLPTPCPAPCDCTEYIDDILFSRTADELTAPGRYIFTHMRKQTLVQTERFIRCHIDREYRCRLLAHK